MKVYKYLFMAMGVMGLLASLMNSFYFESSSKTDHSGFAASVFLIWFAITINRHVKRVP
ncbi:hypothetical protein ACFQ0I_11650 [Mariniflexile aquimaris]|uniref:Uncharacterized protein n=1 Tax=Mariniflexile aquimaris TaxID=881009 RepID=A0ABW3BU31_9FLAO